MFNSKFAPFRCLRSEGEQSLNGVKWEKKWSKSGVKWREDGENTETKPPTCVKWRKYGVKVSKVE